MNTESKILGERIAYEELVYFNEENNIMIFSTLNWNDPFPYFKLYIGDIKDLNATNIYKKCNTSKMCRISLIEPKYINVEGENLILSYDQKILLNNILSSIDNKEEVTIYGKLIELYNFFHMDDDFASAEQKEIFKEKYMIKENVSIPDYTNLTPMVNP